ncbi:hypothetical protein BS17DRAFT_788986 [Gyrodon lividus]|nr:hypothetical protein BS17DRAFT_788986 [Gyrodon lividus]
MRNTPLISFAMAVGSATAASLDTLDVNTDVQSIVSRVFLYRPMSDYSPVSDYRPDKMAAGVAGALYLLATISLFARLFSNRAWWGLYLPIGSAFMSLGLFMRIPMAMYPNSLPIFMVQQLFTILPPAAYLAFNYVLYGRFMVTCIDPKYSLIKSKRVAKYFVISDITTLLIQGGGGGLESSNNSTGIRIGADALLGGLILQTLSFALFIVLVLHAYRGLVKDGVRPSQEPWGMILWTLFFSSALFLVRCIYRVVELGQLTGGGDYLMTHEIYFYMFDLLPLLVGICTYIIFWPPKYLATKDLHSMNSMVSEP